MRNTELATAVTDHYGELSPLITDDVSAEVFQLTYMKMTRRPVGDDIVSEFKKVFNTTMRELDALSLRQRCTIITFDDAISTEGPQEEAADQ